MNSGFPDMGASILARLLAYHAVFATMRSWWMVFASTHYDEQDYIRDYEILSSKVVQIIQPSAQVGTSQMEPADYDSCLQRNSA